MKYEQHEIGKCYPELQPVEYLKLRESIRENGVRLPAAVYQGKILDGWHRARACDDLGIELPIVEPDITDPLTYAQDLNDRRRMLTKSQLSIVAGKQARLKQGAPGGNINAVKTNTSPGGVCLQDASLQSLAKKHKISHSMAERGLAIVKKGNSAVIKAVEEGKIGANTGAKIVTHSKQQQSKILEEVLEKKKTKVRSKRKSPRNNVLRSDAEAFSLAPQPLERTDDQLINDIWKNIVVNGLYDLAKDLRPRLLQYLRDKCTVALKVVQDARTPDELYFAIKAMNKTTNNGQTK